MFPKLQIFIEMFSRAQEGNENIWNLLWLSRRLTVLNNQTFTYKALLPNTLTSKKVKRHKIRIYFLTNVVAARYQAMP